MVIFDVGEDWFDIVAPLLPFFDTPFAFQFFLGQLFQAVQVVVDLYDPVHLLLVALRSDRTTLTVPCLVTGDGLQETGRCSGMVGTDPVHRLPAGAMVEVPVGIIAELVHGVGLLAPDGGVLVPVEVMVLDVCSTALPRIITAQPA